MVGRILVAVVVLMIFFGAINLVTGGVHDLRTEEITQNAAVTTGAGVTTGNVTLSRELFNDALSEISSVTSSIDETPIANSYVSATRLLNLSALDESQTRTLTIVYSSEREDTYMQILGPFLTFLIVFGVIGALIFSVWKKR